MPASTEPISEFFDRECCAAVDPGASPLPGAAGVTAVLLEALAEVGIDGRRMLELGSGDGGLSRELASRGAAEVTGIDLSPVSVEVATAKAHDAGLGAKLRYRVGDGALEPLDEYDAVVSQKVFCCYPKPDRLLANTLPAARTVYALVVPESRGIVGLLAKLLVATENILRRITREGFRAYVHDVRMVEAAIRASGFERRAARRHWGWLVLVFERVKTAR